MDKVRESKSYIFQKGLTNYLIRVNGKKVGWFVTDIFPLTLKNFSELHYINAVFVTKEYRSKGVFAYCLKYMQNYYRVHGVLLSTDRAEKYYDYYKNLGFSEPIKINQNAYILVDDYAKKISEKNNFIT